MNLDVDFCQPFMLDRTGLRGRFVRLGPAVQKIVEKHAYPPLVNDLLVELAGVAVLLASSLKYDGVFTLQTSSDGPVGMMVVDMDSDGNLRACARFDDRRLAALSAQEPAPMGSVSRLLGQGHMAFTVDQGPDSNPYQGIVPLEQEQLAACVEQYFRQSEQLRTAIDVAVSQGDQPGGWWVGALMVQRLPHAGASADDAAAEEDWNRSEILMRSATPDEMVDISLSPETVLYRLFHEEAPRIYDRQEIRFACRCTRERIGAMLSRFDLDELMEMREEQSGQVVVTCEFCSSRYAFDDAELHTIVKDRETADAGDQSA